MPYTILQSVHPLVLVRVTGEQATDHPHPEDATRTVIGTPVAVTGAKGTIKRFLDVPDTIAAAISAEPDPTKRSAMLTNVSGRLLKGNRVSVRADVLAAWRSENLAAVTATPDKPTRSDRENAHARSEGMMLTGLVILPTVATEDEDALSWVFGIADDDSEDAPTDSGTEEAPEATPKGK